MPMNPVARNSISMACNGMSNNFKKFERKLLSARSQKNGKIGHNSNEIEHKSDKIGHKNDEVEHNNDEIEW